MLRCCLNSGYAEVFMLSQVGDVTQVRVKNVQPFLYWGIVKWCSFPTLLSYLVRSRYAGY